MTHTKKSPEFPARFTPGKVEMEVFYTYLADLPDLGPRRLTGAGGYGVQGWANAYTEFALRRWWFHKLPEEIKSRIRLRLSPVGAMPGGNPALNGYHVEYQKMVMAWEPNEMLRVNNPIHWKLRKHLSRTRYIPQFDARKARASTEQTLERAGVPIDEWRRGAASVETIEAMHRNTERLAEITRRSRALNER